MTKLLNIFGIIFLSGIMFFSLAQKTEAKLNPPSQILPCNDITTSLTPTLKWDSSISGASGYQWLIEDILGNRVSYGDVGMGLSIPPTEATIPVNKLELGKSYKWNVRTWDQNLIRGDPSPWCNFTTQTTSPIPASPTPGVPYISSLNPLQGPKGTLLTIKGSNFDPYHPNNIIEFDQTGFISAGYKKSGQSIRADANELEINIPGWLSDGNVSIKVIANGEPSNARIFTVGNSAVPPPTASGQVSGSGASMKRDCEGKPLTIKNPSLYQATNTKEWITVGYDGLVPCGKCVVTARGKVQDVKSEIDNNTTTKGVMAGTGQYVSCQFCHFFVMFGGIVNFLLLKIAIPAAILLLVIGGAMFVFAAGNPGTIKKGTDIMKSVAIGLVIMFTAWIVVSTILTLIGVADWTGLRNGWFGINCPINI